MSKGIYRQIYSSIWSDLYFLNMNPYEKLAWLYLLTNAKTTQSGIYEFSFDYMVFETKIPEKELNNILKKLINDNKIAVNRDTNEIALLNWKKWNSMKSNTIVICVRKELKNVKDRRLIHSMYPEFRDDYPIDTLSMGYSKKEEEKEQEEEQEKEPDNPDEPAKPKEPVIEYDSIIDYLNQKTGKLFQVKSKQTRKLIHARSLEGATLENFKYVIDVKCAEWKGSDFEKHLCPDTLFAASHFEKYLNQSIPKKKNGIEGSNNRVGYTDDDFKYMCDLTYPPCEGCGKKPNRCTCNSGYRKPGERKDFFIDLSKE